MSLNNYALFFKTKIKFGAGIISTVGKEAKNLNMKKVLVTADKGIIKAGLLEPVVESLSESGIDYIVFDEIVPNPRDIHIEAGYKFVVNENIDGIIALGGGSSMDTAKCIGTLLTHGGPIKKWCGSNLLEREITPIIAIPTTAGTGSEVTPFAVVTDTETHEKLNVFDERVAPVVALIDPETLLKLPSHIMAACGIDAMTHAVEAYTCKIATPHTDAFALYAIEAIQKNLIGAVESPTLENCSGLMLGSSIAGLAFGYSDTAGVHCMAEALGGKYDLPHGVANAMLLPTVTRFNVQAAEEKYARVAVALGVKTDGLTSLEASYAGADALELLCDAVHIPKMREYDIIKPKDFKDLAISAVNNVSTPDNPRSVNKDDFLELFNIAYYMDEIRV